jgi:hypothetical protein
MDVRKDVAGWIVGSSGAVHANRIQTMISLNVKKGYMFCRNQS